MKKPFARAVALAAIATAALATTGTAGAATIPSLKYAVNPGSATTLNTLDPAKTFNQIAWQALYMTCANLYTNPDVDLQLGGRAVPEVANGQPSVSADGLTYTFSLRSGFKFSDGTPVTPSAYATAIQRLKDPTINSPGASYASDIGSVSANDAANTLTIVLSAQHADIVDRLAMPLFCPVLPGTGSSPTFPLPSSGPYKVGSLTAGSALTLVPNPNYGGSRPHNASSIEFISVGSPMVASIDAGTYDLSDNLDNYSGAHATWGPGSTNAQQGHQRFFVKPSNRLDYLALNTNRVLANVNLRLAVANALDRNALVQAASPFALTPWSQYLTPGIPGFAPDPSALSLGPNVPAAQTYLAASGVGNPPLTIYCQGPVRCAQGNIIKNNLAAIGLTNVTVTTPGNFFTAIANPNEPFDIAVTAWIPDFVDPGNVIAPLLRKGSPSNSSFWNSDTWTDGNGISGTARIDTASTLLAPDRYDAFGQLAQEIDATSPIAVFGHGNWRFYFSSSLGCETINPAYGIALGSLCIPDVQGSVGTNGTVSSGSSVTSSDPVATAVTSPSAGTVSINETQSLNGTAPAGYSFFNQQVTIEAPPAPDANHPLVLEFTLDASLLGATPPDSVTLFRDGVAIEGCTGAGANPDPCVVRPATPIGSPATAYRYTVRSTHASKWNFGKPFSANVGELQQPVDPLPTFNKMKGGAAVPVKFSLGSNLGLDIFAPAYPKSTAIACPNATVPVDAVEETIAADASRLNYDATANQYSYIWKTDKSWASTCRQLVVRFANGVERQANFQFTK